MLKIVFSSCGSRTRLDILCRLSRKGNGAAHDHATAPFLTAALRVSLLISCLVLLGACACPEARDLRRLEGQSLGTPEAAVEYFREAFSTGTADDMFLCFSEALKAEEPDLTLGNVALYKDRIRRYMNEQLGDIQSIEVLGVTMRPGQDRVAAVALRSGRHSSTLLLIEESSALVQWTDGGFDAYQWPKSSTPLSGTGSALSLGFPRPLRTTWQQSDIHRLEFSRDWKILGLEGTSIARDLDIYLREGPSEVRPPGAGSESGASFETQSNPATPRGPAP